MISQQGGTQISLKIKMKRQRSGELWEIVSVREESTVEESKSCGSSDDPLTTHSLAEVTALYSVGWIPVTKLSLVYSQGHVDSKATLCVSLLFSKVLPCHMLYIYFSFLTSFFSWTFLI